MSDKHTSVSDIFGPESAPAVNDRTPSVWGRLELETTLRKNTLIHTGAWYIQCRSLLVQHALANHEPLNDYLDPNDMINFIWAPRRYASWAERCSALIETAIVDEAIKYIFLLEPEEIDPNTLAKRWGLTGEGQINFFGVQKDPTALPLKQSGPALMRAACNFVYGVDNGVMDLGLAPGQRPN